MRVGTIDIQGGEINITDTANEVLRRLKDAIGRINNAMKEKNAHICSTADEKLKQLMYIIVLFILQNCDSLSLSDILATSRVEQQWLGPLRTSTFQRSS